MNIFLIKTKNPNSSVKLGNRLRFVSGHWSLVVASLKPNFEDNEEVLVYDAVPKRQKIKARKRKFRSLSVVGRIYPDAEVENINQESFSVAKADAYVERVNNGEEEYNPLTNNCQEFIQQLTRFAGGQSSCVEDTIGDKMITALHWIYAMILTHLLFILLSCCTLFFFL